MLTASRDGSGITGDCGRASHPRMLRWLSCMGTASSMQQCLQKNLASVWESCLTITNTYSQTDKVSKRGSSLPSVQIDEMNNVQQWLCNEAAAKADLPDRAFMVWFTCGMSDVRHVMGWTYLWHGVSFHIPPANLHGIVLSAMSYAVLLTWCPPHCVQRIALHMLLIDLGSLPSAAQGPAAWQGCRRLHSADAGLPVGQPEPLQMPSAAGWGHAGAHAACR